LPRIQLAELRRARGELDSAIELLEHCAREYPQFVGSVLPYASALLASGAPPETVVAEVQACMPDLTAGARFMLGTALYESGATAAGEEQFRLVLARQPHSARARVALGEALLAQRRYADAAAVAGEVPVEDPLAVMACRTELFARIAGADEKRTPTSLERARVAGMPQAEWDLLEGWHRAASTGDTSFAPSPGALPLLVTILEALLRVQDFDSFESLHPLLLRVPLPARERRQLLAEMYLRRGFLASAAEEWMAVCNEQEPDAQALVGLARVATAQGMNREASDFAAAALACEPNNRAAAQILAAAQAAVA
jgi:tetratricopeptide (TPR) repeat protein